MAQTAWWGVRNVAWARRPITIPILVLIAALAGITPSHIADAIMSVARRLSNQIWSWEVQISQSWLLDPWFIASLFGGVVFWLIVRSARIAPDPDSDFPPRKTAPKPALPIAVTPATPKNDKCMVGRIWCHSDASTPLVHSGCTQDGFFRIPIADGDCLSPEGADTATPNGSGENCTLCDNHFNLYQQHIRQSTCQGVQCFRIGLPYHTPEGAKYERIEHGKERIIADQMPISLSLRPAKKTDVVSAHAPKLDSLPIAPPSPPMSSLEAIPAHTPRQHLVSCSSGALSTGKSMGELTDKLHELGGRRKSRSTSDPQPLSDGPPTNRRDNPENVRAAEPVGARHTTPVSNPWALRSSLDSLTRDAPSARGSSSESHASSTSRRSSSRSRRHPTRKRKHKKKRKSSRASSSGGDESHKSYRGFLPKRLTYSRPKMARKTVRHISVEGPTAPRGHNEAIVDRLSAMQDRDDRKAGAPSKVEQFTVCALRGFGSHMATLATGTYGKEMESCLQRQGRSERDRLWRDKLRIPITNRIAKAAASGLFGNAEADVANEITITLRDCIPLDSVRYRAHRWGGEKIEPAGKEPQTMNCFISSVNQNIRLFLPSIRLRT